MTVKIVLITPTTDSVGTTITIVDHVPQCVRHDRYYQGDPTKVPSELT